MHTEKLMRKISAIVELTAPQEIELEKVINQFVSELGDKELDLKKNILSVIEKGTRQRDCYKNWERKVMKLCQN